MSRPFGRPNAELRLLAACGTRPVRRLALLMAELGEVPTIEELRAMIREQYRLAAMRGRETALQRRRDGWREAA